MTYVQAVEARLFLIQKNGKRATIVPVKITENGPEELPYGQFGVPMINFGLKYQGIIWAGGK